jgi:broad specificity phosphatase PhoE
VRLLVVRHGETDYNRDGRLQGQEHDVPLNATGVAQAQQLSEQIDERIDYLVSSPLVRARQTAQILARDRDVAVRLDTDLMEIAYGRLAGMTWDEVRAATGDAAIEQRNRSLAFDYRAIGGECWDDVRGRVLRFVATWRRLAHGATVLATSHGGVIATLQRLFPDVPRLSRGNCSVHVFTLT